MARAVIAAFPTVMVVLVTTIHDLFGQRMGRGVAKEDVDGRHKADHDDRIDSASAGSTTAPERLT
jgi:hypothetical protein